MVLGANDGRTLQSLIETEDVNNVKFVNVDTVTNLDDVPPDVAAVLRHTQPAKTLREEGQRLQAEERDFRGAWNKYKEALWHYQQAYDDNTQLREHSLVTSLIDIVHNLCFEIEDERLRPRDATTNTDYHRALFQDIYNVYRDFSVNFPNNAETASVLARWSNHLMEQKDYETALEKCHEAVAICEQVFGNIPNEQWADACCSLAAGYFRTEEYALALHYLKQVLAMYQAYGALEDKIETCRMAITVCEQKIGPSADGETTFDL